MTRVRVWAGACGFTNVIKVRKITDLTVSIKIISACKLVREMNEDLMIVDCKEGVFSKIFDSIVYESANRRLKQHTDCPVPCAILKAIQVEIGGSVRKETLITFEDEG